MIWLFLNSHYKQNIIFLFEKLTRNVKLCLQTINNFNIDSSSNKYKYIKFNNDNIKVKLNINSSVLFDNNNENNVFTQFNIYEILKNILDCKEKYLDDIV